MVLVHDGGCVVFSYTDYVIVKGANDDDDELGVLVDDEVVMGLFRRLYDIKPKLCVVRMK